MDPGFEEAAIGEFAGNPMVAAGDIHDEVVRVWDASTGRLVGSLDVDADRSSIRGLALRESNNGRLVAVVTGSHPETTALALTDVGAKPALISVNEEEGEEYKGRWGDTRWYSIVRVWDLTMKPVMSGKLAVRSIGSANGVAAGFQARMSSSRHILSG